jgi:hypothetical protein
MKREEPRPESHDTAPRNATASEDPILDRALAQLPRVDLPPWAAATQLRTARKRLHGRERASRLERYEPAVLIACSALHLVWVLWRVLL